MLMYPVENPDLQEFPSRSRGRDLCNKSEDRHDESERRLKWGHSLNVGADAFTKFFKILAPRFHAEPSTMNTELTAEKSPAWVFLCTQRSANGTGIR